ncbi:MAG TPA: hypothetical protein PK771_13405, partial [Spirochaetota bacterium]|nr:hypothetical protein [Spirochaetota bacterium]
MNLKKNFNTDSLKKHLEIIEINPDISYLTENQKKVISYLIEATKIIDDVFFIQKYRRNLELKEEIKNLNDKKLLTYFTIQQGAFDQFNNNESYIEGIERNDRSGFYPEDLTINEWETFLKNHIDEKNVFISNWTVITRDKSELNAIPYSQ